jgi:hypothetical protein
VQAQILLGSALANLKDLDGAIAQMEQAITLDAGQSRTYAALGALQMVKGQAAEAEAALRKAIALDPKSVDARLTLGHYLWTTGKVKDAEATSMRTGRDPKHALTLRAMATLLSRPVGCPGRSPGGNGWRAPAKADGVVVGLLPHVRPSEGHRESAAGLEAAPVRARRGASSPISHCSMVATGAYAMVDRVSPGAT